MSVYNAVYIKESPKHSISKKKNRKQLNIIYMKWRISSIIKFNSAVFFSSFVALSFLIAIVDYSRDSMHFLEWKHTHTHTRGARAIWKWMEKKKKTSELRTYKVILWIPLHKARITRANLISKVAMIFIMTIVSGTISEFSSPNCAEKKKQCNW